MTKRTFKPGDRVEHKLGGPIMKIIRFEMACLPQLEEVLSDEDVCCEWFENGERKTAVFDHRTLNRSCEGIGLS